MLFSERCVFEAEETSVKTPRLGVFALKLKSAKKRDYS